MKYNLHASISSVCVRVCVCVYVGVGVLACAHVCEEFEAYISYLSVRISCGYMSLLYVVLEISDPFVVSVF